MNAIDDVDSNLKLVDLVREHFPHLQIVARARNVPHWYALRSRGVTLLERELFDSALIAGRHVLEVLGVRPHEARERADKFRRHNLALLEGLRGDEGGDQSQRVARVREARDELERQFRRDLDELDRHVGREWHEDGDR